MSHHRSNHRNVPMYVPRSSKDVLIKTASDLLASDNPTRLIAGIAVGTIAVAGLAINAISNLNR